jgi:choline dehydrogenase
LVAIDLPTRPAPGPHRFQAHATFRSSRVAPGDPADLTIFVAGPFDVGPDQVASGAVFGLVAGVLAPTSRGWVRLASADPSVAPRIYPAHLADDHDLERMIDAVLEARRLARTEPLATEITGPELSPGPSVPTEDRGALATWLRSAVSTFHHPVGTCAMGPDPTRGAVTDWRGSVHGVEQLTVADASIMPIIPTANTNVPTMMVAEHIAAVLEERK